MTRFNGFIDVLERQEFAFGSFVRCGDKRMAADIGDSSFDFALIDMEHEGMDLPDLGDTMQWLISRRQAARGGLLTPTPLVRVPINPWEGNHWVIQQVLDYGAFGIVAPRIGTAAAAEAVVTSARYAQGKDSAYPLPAGHRGVWNELAGRYWGVRDFPDYLAKADVWPLNPDGELLVVVMIEDARGVGNIEEILQVPGVGAVYTGDADLCQDMGYPWQFRHPAVMEAKLSVVEACHKAGIAVGCTAAPQEWEERAALGFQFCINPPSALRPPAIASLAEIRAARARQGPA
jgi:4-hydroxy-2-oxoheptanedioate aldolase